MTAYAYRNGLHWVEINGPFERGGIQYPANWPDLASPTERTVLGLFEIEEPGPEPQDVRILGTVLTGGATPARIWATEPYPLPEARAMMWARAKGIRESRMAGGCETPLGRMDTDDASQRKLNGAVTNALITQLAGQPFLIDWTMADNSVVAHDGPAIIAAGIAVAQHIAACQNRGTLLRAAIDAGEDPFAVDITGDWPE